MSEVEFTVGQQVRPRYTSGYSLTMGKVYTVLKFEPKCRDQGGAFTWPAYVTVLDDFGKTVVAHAHRFVAVEEQA